MIKIICIILAIICFAYNIYLDIGDNYDKEKEYLKNH